MVNPVGFDETPRAADVTILVHIIRTAVDAGPRRAKDGFFLGRISRRNA